MSGFDRYEIAILSSVVMKTWTGMPRSRL